MSQGRSDPTAALLDIRIYRIQAGKGAEFDTLVRNETVPLARNFGHAVLGFGPSVEDSDIYCLVRWFPTREERHAALDRLYTSAEWLEQYDAKVSALVVSYETVVLPVRVDVVAAWTQSDES